MLSGGIAAGAEGALGVTRMHQSRGCGGCGESRMQFKDNVELLASSGAVPVEEGIQSSFHRCGLESGGQRWNSQGQTLWDEVHTATSDVMPGGRLTHRADLASPRSSSVRALTPRMSELTPKGDL